MKTETKNWKQRRIKKIEYNLKKKTEKMNWKHRKRVNDPSEDKLKTRIRKRGKDPGEEGKLKTRIKKKRLSWRTWSRRRMVRKKKGWKEEKKRGKKLLVVISRAPAIAVGGGWRRSPKLRGGCSWQWGNERRECC